ncbi:hemerythrin domain-containing protein [Candidatus Cyanaurora vandensis]|uniref:hemerythrin domain-containing protein n=1 Tax=Candidatus Cyanaurora vandensis TaxID=2714958 RepID=UPI002580E974|nr:hemerythrin domain-containing protein [Candidatus Cyanaurora vandensis]
MLNDKMAPDELRAGIGTKLDEPSRAVTGPLNEGDVFELLKVDHDRLADLFVTIETETDPGALSTHVELLARQLLTHTTLEEEIFYPQVRNFADTEGQVEKNYEQHQEAKEILQQIQRLDPSTQDFKAAVQDLQRAIENHVHEEENYLFPAVKGDLSDEALANLTTQIREGKARYATQYNLQSL